MAEVRGFNAEDGRRELAVAMLLDHIRKAGITTDYSADVEFFDFALLAFVDEWTERGVVPSGEDGLEAIREFIYAVSGRFDIDDLENTINQAIEARAESTGTLRRKDHQKDSGDG